MKIVHNAHQWIILINSKHCQLTKQERIMLPTEKPRMSVGYTYERMEQNLAARKPHEKKRYFWFLCHMDVYYIIRRFVAPSYKFNCVIPLCWR